MLDQVIRNLSVNLMVEVIRHPDPTVRARLAQTFWELQYLYRFNLPKVPGLDLLLPRRVGPDPSSTDRLQVHEDALFSLADAVLSNPESQRATPNIMSVLTDESVRLAGAKALSQRLAVANNLLAAEIARLEGIILAANQIERISFTVDGVGDAAASQGSNFDKEKVNIAWRQALSLWSAAAPLEFQPPFAGQEPLIRIHFVRDNRQSNVLGTTSGFVSRTPRGPIGGATINIDCDNHLFIDRFLEPVRLPTENGPFDFIGVLAHEVGHALGLDHPPTDPTTGAETEFGMMSASKGSGAVIRQLFPFDIRNVQRLHGVIRLSDPVKANLADTSQLIDASPGIQLQKGSFGALVFGPMETKAFLDMLVPAKGRLVNALRLKFTTVTANVFVNRVETFDGIIPLQQFAVSARANGQEGLAGKPQDLLFGFLHRPNMINDMLVRMDLRFTRQGGQPQSDFGVMQLHEVSGETLPKPLEVFDRV